jgi:thiosulfate reductase / polysulfide reductase chain A
VEKKSFTVSRRGFLKGSAALTAGALGVGLLDFRSWSNTMGEGPVTRVPTICGGCGNRCAIIAFVKNRRIWKIEGNPDANGNRGNVCPRGHGYLHEVYNPNRIRFPLKRVNGKLQKISWDQAYKEISQKINLILMDNGPESLFWVNYPQPNQAYALRLMHAMGSPHYFTHGSTCYTARNAAWNVTVGKLPSNDMSHAKAVMIIGRNPAGGIEIGEVKDIIKAKENGAKLFVVDPRHSETAILADEWLPIRPGTDLALLLAMINVMVEEKLYDEEFVTNNTVGFEQLCDEVINYPPQWAEKVCDIPAETIVRLTRDLSREKPRALIHRGYHGVFGAQYLNSFQTARAVAITNTLLGSINREGGVYFSETANLGELQPAHPVPPGPSGPKSDGTGIPGRYPLGSYGDGISHAIPELALRGILKAGFVYHHNPLRTNPNPKRVIAGYKKLELLVVIDPFLSETASIAHYVLPASFFLEADDAVDTKHSGKVAQVSLQQKVIDPLFDTRSGFQIICDLAKHLGVGKYFNFTLTEANELRLKPLGVALNDLKSKGVVPAGPAWEPGIKKLETPSGKIEIAAQTLEKLGYPAIPRWEGPFVAPDEKDPHSFRLLHGKQGVHTHTMTANEPYLMAISHRYGMIHLLMNRSRAAKIGVKDGDTVLVKSTVGEGKIRVKLTEGLHPSCVWLPSGYGGFSKHLKTAYDQGLSYNDFLPTMFDPTVGHAMSSEIVVRVTRA